ncbi:MAG: hypothetical protein KKA42_13155, partial [candidate division Zixibacteria bacterium]|nr:hypothetical protein [candidate division Zixibacteria bacterium]
MDVFSTPSAGRQRLFRCFALLCLILGTTVGAVAQDEPYEEIVVGFEIPKLVKQDMFVQFDGTTVYLPLTETFTLLGYFVEPVVTDNQIRGSLVNRSEKFSINLETFELKAPDLKYQLLSSDYYFINGELYLRIDLFQRLFALKMHFE